MERPVPHKPSSRALAATASALLSWFDQNQRTYLPWRRSKDPYKIWISELMLQQTRVDQAIPYFASFIERFPNVRVLASAPPSAVLKAWSGLGYYRRAKYAHAAAQAIVNNHAGQVPGDYHELRKLPGFGPYTAAAVVSIAFDKAHAALDGNAIRVMSRVFRIEGDVKKATTRRHLLASLQGLLNGRSAGRITQAVMELGALVCLPRSPRCTSCPIRNKCRAYQELPNPAILPQRAISKPKPHFKVAAGILIRDGRVLLIRRPENGLLADFWEFPGGKKISGKSLEDTCRIKFKNKTGLSVRLEAKASVIHHEFTHFSITVHFYTVSARNGQLPTGCRARWIRMRKLNDYAVNLVSKKALAALDGI